MGALAVFAAKMLKKCSIFLTVGRWLHLVNATSHVGSRKILVVDDNPVLLRALSLALGARGYDVFTAVDASEAFGFARLEKPDLILLDIFFPPEVTQNGMTWDAFRIIEWMQRVGVAVGVPIIVMTGAEPEEFEDRCLAVGAAAFFHKPINIAELLDAIRRIFDPVVEAAESEPGVNSRFAFARTSKAMPFQEFGRLQPAQSCLSLTS